MKRKLLQPHRALTLLACFCAAGTWCAATVDASNRETLALMSKTWKGFEDEVNGVEPTEQAPAEDDGSIVLLGVRSTPHAIGGARGLYPNDPRRAEYDRADAARTKLNEPYDNALTTQSDLTGQVTDLRRTIEDGSKQMQRFDEEIRQLTSLNETDPDAKRSTAERIGALSESRDKVRGNVDRAQAKLAPLTEQLTKAQAQTATLEAERNALANTMSEQDRKISEAQKAARAAKK